MTIDEIIAQEKNEAKKNKKLLKATEIRSKKMMRERKK